MKNLKIKNMPISVSPHNAMPLPKAWAKTILASLKKRLITPFTEVTKEHNQEYNYWNKQKLIMEFLLLFIIKKN